MKEFVEEYGGVMAASILGMVILGVMSGLLGAEGELSHFIFKFMNGMGTVLR